jgi:glycine hydroxymethyltransferase
MLGRAVRFLQSQQKFLSLTNQDPEVYKIIQDETKRQKEGINMIPSENHCSKAVLETLGSVMYCKYAEGI